MRSATFSSPGWMWGNNPPIPYLTHASFSGWLVEGYEFFKLLSIPPWENFPEFHLLRQLPPKCIHSFCCLSAFLTQELSIESRNPRKMQPKEFSFSTTTSRQKKKPLLPYPARIEPSRRFSFFSRHLITLWTVQFSIFPNRGKKIQNPPDATRRGPLLPLHAKWVGEWVGGVDTLFQKGQTHFLELTRWCAASASYKAQLHSVRGSLAAGRLRQKESRRRLLFKNFERIFATIFLLFRAEREREGEHLLENERVSWKGGCFVTAGWEIWRNFGLLRGCLGKILKYKMINSNKYLVKGTTKKKSLSAPCVSSKVQK